MTYPSSSIDSPPSGVSAISMPISESAPSPLPNAPASAAPKRPSSVNGFENSETICAWPTCSAPGATWFPLPATATVEGMSDGWTSGGREKYGIFWWFQSVRIWRAAARVSGVPPYRHENMNACTRHIYE